jgi:hypothetical protein
VRAVERGLQQLNAYRLRLVAQALRLTLPELLGESDARSMPLPIRRRR